VLGSKGKESASQAFSADVMVHLDHLYRVAFHLVKNHDEAQDFVQETCLRALSSQKQFTPGTNLKAWLTKILYNFFYDSYHRAKRVVSAENRAEQQKDGGDYWEKVPIDNPGPEKDILHKELTKKISDALKKIPEEFRSPLVLIDMGDLSYVEAAEILACPVGTIRSRLSRGRRLLREHLKGYVSPAGR
jgi:RNA polymerase sigma-70 factor (ECF subfamily)